MLRKLSEKKKLKKLAKKHLDEISKETVESIEYKPNAVQSELTDAQKKFVQTAHNRLVDKFDNDKELSYKDRLSQFNRKLDTLSEHFDIQKVSWTK